MQKSKETRPEIALTTDALETPASQVVDLEFVKEFKSTSGVFRNFEGILVLLGLVACVYWFH